MTTTIRSSADGSKSYIAVGGTDRVAIGSQGIEAGSFAPGSIGDADLSLSANSSPVKAALNATGGAPIYACRAWVNFNGTGTVTIKASGNVSSITDNGVGDYTINFATAMPDANYAASSFVSGYSDNGTALYVVAYKPQSGANGNPPLTKTVSAARIMVGQGYGASYHDVPDVSLTFIR